MNPSEIGIKPFRPPFIKVGDGVHLGLVSDRDDGIAGLVESDSI